MRFFKWLFNLFQEDEYDYLERIRIQGLGDYDESRWCRIFEVENGEQILFVADLDDDGKPTLRYTIDIGGGRATLHVPLKDEEGVEYRSLASLTQEGAQELYNNLVLEVVGMLGEDDE